jgi:DNA polymerase-3 subunit alpha
MRDDRISLIANDLAVPDLSAIGVAKPLAVTISTRMCTPDKIGMWARARRRPC